MTKPFRLETKDLAEKLYVELMSRNIVFADNAVKTAVSSENVAKLCFILAETFLHVQDDLNADNLPKDPTFKLGADDIAGWMK
jgi:hypothetical protein